MRNQLLARQTATLSLAAPRPLTVTSALQGTPARVKVHRPSRVTPASTQPTLNSNANRAQPATTARRPPHGPKSRVPATTAREVPPTKWKSPSATALFPLQRRLSRAAMDTTGKTMLVSSARLATSARTTMASVMLRLRARLVSTLTMTVRPNA